MSSHRPSVVASQLLVAYIFTSGPLLAEESVASIQRGMEESHRRLLQLPEGLSISYTMRVSQDPRHPYFLWDNGTRGRLVIRWPRLYCSIKGHRADNHQELEREGEYNFASKLAGGRDQMFVQFTPYRQAWSAVHLFPLRYLYFEESHQGFVPGEVLETEYWLPSALSRGTYSVTGHEVIDGARCVKISSSDTSDMLWVAPTQDYLVCRREIRDSRTGRVRETTSNKHLRALAQGIWFPREQVREEYDYRTRWTRNTGKPTHTISIHIDRIESAPGTDTLHVHVPEGASVEDQISGATYRKTGLGDHAFDTAIKQVKFKAAHRTPTQRLLIPSPFALISLGSFSVLTMLLGVLAYKARSRRFRRSSTT